MIFFGSIISKLISHDNMLNVAACSTFLVSSNQAIAQFIEEKYRRVIKTHIERVTTTDPILEIGNLLENNLILQKK